MTDHHIHPLANDQWSGVLALLEENGLPEAGLSEHREGVFVAHHQGAVTGSVALEVYGDYGLLRSLAVKAGFRGTGLGGALTQTALADAAAQGLHEVFLLTETAESFFQARGFVPVDRLSVPGPIRNTVEFSEVCPVSAVVMKTTLKPPDG